MARQRIENDRSTTTGSTLVSKALNDLASLKWLTPLTTLLPKRSGEFGRQIEISLNQLAETQKILKLQLRKSDKAVVIGVDQYQAILNMKKHYEELVEKVRELELTQAASEYDQLFQRIASPTSRQAADTLFEASDEELNNAYKG
ncbi:hypothetical protein MNBD_GAMMA09-399 [hydrothermal vent metagenome]|uniref:Uncharacterized protein n=1 Tax=hydrothermal vent metagenome TaxID=652676 RepID=A0A3B0YG90_9ZZZZ